MRAEGGEVLHKKLIPPFVEPFRIEVFEQLLVGGAHLFELAFFAIPLLLELFCSSEFIGDLPHG